MTLHWRRLKQNVFFVWLCGRLNISSLLFFYRYLHRRQSHNIYVQTFKPTKHLQFFVIQFIVIFSNTISGILMLAEQYSSLMFNVANKFFIDPYIFNILCKQWVSEAANLFNKWEYVNPNKKVLSEKTNILFHRMANFHFYLTQVFQKFVRANIAHL
jgi:hypothetical protein